MKGEDRPDEDAVAVAEEAHRGRPPRLPGAFRGPLGPARADLGNRQITR